MKSQVFGILLFVFCKALIVAFAEDKICPDNLVNCTCYEPTGYMECHDLNADWAKKFQPKANYKYTLDTLVIKHSPNLPQILEHFDNSNSFTAKTVIYTLDGELDTAPGNFNALVQIAQEALEIIHTGTSTTKIEIDAQLLNTKLTSLSLRNVKVNKLDKLKPKEMEVLSNLKLYKVTTDGDVKNVIITLPKLTRIEITDCDEFKGKFQFIPSKKCNPNQQIELILQNNKGLTDFDMTKMFATDCKYYVDLSGSENLKKTFLIDNKNLFKNSVKTPGQLYIILRDIKFDCDQCVYDWYFPLKQYVHSVKCFDQGKTTTTFIDLVDKTKLTPCK